ncbi:phage terminase large subunit [Brevundimonas sp.]|uniref:phage terminase large subunit n=1 Tax=Brevundimonas sp. TaxID=1871086 RepID=UPI0028AC16A2|nr:phage terminase large subunit [Brevundimonas sp.]
MSNALTDQQLDQLRSARDPEFLKTLTDDQRAALKVLHKRALKQDLEYFAESVAPAFVKDHEDATPARHHRLMLHHLKRVASGECRRLMIFCPPGVAKSTYGVRIFTPFYLANNPKTKAIVTSSSQKLAWQHSDWIKSLLNMNADALGTKAVNDSRELWNTDNGCELLAVSSGQAFQGFRADLAFIDDPVGGIEDVKSDQLRDNLWEWFNANLLGRVTPSGRIVIIMTRWHDDDLAGRLIKLAKDSGDDQDWTVLSLPAIWEEEEDEPAWPNGLGRTNGELIWPEYQTEAFYKEKRRGDEFTFQAMYQCNPLPPGGAVFRANLLKPVDAASVHVRKVVRAWDLAATTKRGSDWTVGVKMQLDNRGQYTILDVVRIKGGPEEVRSTILNTAAADGRGVYISLPKDPGQAGIAQVRDFTNALAGYVVEATPETGSKVDRARPYAAQMNAENVSMIVAPWNKDFTDEHAGFPNLKHDDQVDAASRAFGCLLDLPAFVQQPSWGYSRAMTR